MNNIISKRFRLLHGYSVEYHFDSEKRDLHVKWSPHFPATKSAKRKLAHSYRASRNAFLANVASETKTSIAVIEFGGRDEK